MFPVLPAALPFIIGGAQTAIGALQRGGASRRRRKALAGMKHEIPSATEEQLQLARERASRTGLPGEDITRARMESSTAEAISKGESVAETSSDVLGLYQKMLGNKMDMNRKILEAGAQYKSESELQLEKSMGLMADAESQQFYYNKMVPFLSEMQYAGEQSAGGAANIASGVQTAYQGWMNNFMTQQFDEQQGQAGQFGDNRAGLTNMADYGESEDPPWQTGVNAPRAELEPWAPPRSPYNIGHPSREQINRPGTTNNYGTNYPAY